MSSNTQIEAIAGNQKTMSSREIAELTGKEHKNIIRDIRVMLIDLHGAEHLERIVPEQHRNRHSEFIRENADAILAAICGDGSELSHQDQRGFSWVRDARGYVSGFSLDKTHTMTLISGYNVKLRHRIVTRWQELEAEHKAPVALSRLQLIEMAMESEKERLAAVAKSAALEEKIQAQAPKVEALSRIALSDGSFCLRDAAKNLQIREKDLYSFLIEHRWIYRRPMGGVWLAYDDVRHRLLLEHKVTEGKREDGTNWSKSQVRVTTKGLAKLAEMLAGPTKEAAA